MRVNNMKNLTILRVNYKSIIFNIYLKVEWSLYGYRTENSNNITNIQKKKGNSVKWKNLPPENFPDLWILNTPNQDKLKHDTAYK